jgi:BTB/POZ domain.
MQSDHRQLPGISQCRKSRTLWFEDGNIILQAEDVQFKVHKSIFSKQSPVLADLLRSPRTDGDPMPVDGCAVIHLPSDSVTDMRYLLSALYGDK